jgi:hypothetical protein
LRESREGYDHLEALGCISPAPGEEKTMGNIIWIVIAVIVVAAVIAFVVSRSGARRVEADRAQAAEIREKAVEHDRRVREDEARATEADAKAQMARAEAQKRELEAERLAAEADSRSERAEAVRRERDEQLRLADLRDPDVETDEDGNRLDGRTDLDARTDRDGLDAPADHHGRDGGVDTLERDDAPTDGSDPTLDERAQSADPRRG